MSAVRCSFNRCTTGIGLPVLILALVWQATTASLLGQFGSAVQHFPQVVINAGSTTTFSIHNPNPDQAIQVQVRIYSPIGTELAGRDVELEASATESVIFGDPNAGLMRGWAELKSEDDFIASEFFQLFLGELGPRVGVLPSPPSQEIRFLGFVNNQFTSGLAVHNPSPTEPTEVTVRLKNMSGQPPAAAVRLTLAPLQSEAVFLNGAELFGPALVGFEGVVEMSSSPLPVSVLSLIQETSGDVATVAVETESFVVTGPSNTSVGRGALGSNISGVGNTASGVDALFFNAGGTFNTANGAGALFANTEGLDNTASGAGALASNQEGSSNTATGFGALFFNTSSFNTATGAGALFSNTEGTNNTASGFNTLNSNTSGHGNTAMGFEALTSNTTGFSNTAMGVNALQSNTTGKTNTASGEDSLASNTIGSENTAVGNQALKSNTEGSDNTAIGNRALEANTRGRDNTAYGFGALLRNTLGSQNTAVGVLALSDLVTGTNNIGIGLWAGVRHKSGSNNIYIGAVAPVADAEKSNIIRIGNPNHDSAFIAGVLLVPSSSRRFKQDIHDMDEASSDLFRLRPVTFRYKKEYDSEDGRVQYGLIAEEVAELYPELVVNDDRGNAKTVEYQKLPSMLLNELQKQHRQLQEQQAVINDLTERLARLEQARRERE